MCEAFHPFEIQSTSFLMAYIKSTFIQVEESTFQADNVDCNIFEEFINIDVSTRSSRIYDLVLIYICHFHHHFLQWRLVKFDHYRDTRASILGPCIQGILTFKVDSYRKPLQNCFKTNKYCDNTRGDCTCRWPHFSSIGSILMSITKILTSIITILASTEQVNIP